MHRPLSFDDVEVGQVWQSRGRTITEADVVNFAGMTGDYDPLHMDHEAARRSPFGKPVAHGIFGLSLCAGLASQCPWMETVAFVAVADWKFLRPMYIGDTVRCVTEVEGKATSGRRRGLIRWRRRLVNQRDEVVQEGIFETLVAKGAASDRRLDQDDHPIEQTAREMRAVAAARETVVRESAVREAVVREAGAVERIAE